MDSGPAGPSNPGPTQGFKPMQSSEPNQTNPNDKLRVKFSDHELNHERESCSSSTTTSDASDDGDDDDDFFHIDPTEFGRPVPFNPTEPIRSPQTPTTQGEKPPVHPAGRYDVPDPNRIPLEIFNRTKSVSPMEWSVASNESLFSIHTGNASFSRESAFIAGRSGELSPMDGGTMPPLSPVPLMPPLYPVMVTPTATTMPATQLLRKPMNMEVGEGLEEPDDVAEAANAEAMNDVLRAAAIEHESETEKPALDWMHNSANMSRRSDGSVASFQSFAFPILTGSETRTSSIKAEPEHQRMQHHQQQQQQQQQQSPKAATQAAPAPAPPDPVTPGGTTTTTGSKGWCSCFSSCGSCCS